MAVLTAFYRRAETLYAPKNRAKLIISLLSVSAAEKKKSEFPMVDAGGASFRGTFGSNVGLKSG